jgi:hypothetical protein
MRSDLKIWIGVYTLKSLYGILAIVNPYANGRTVLAILYRMYTFTSAFSYLGEKIL